MPKPTQDQPVTINPNTKNVLAATENQSSNPSRMLSSSQCQDASTVSRSHSAVSGEAMTDSGQSSLMNLNPAGVTSTEEQNALRYQPSSNFTNSVVERSSFPPPFNQSYGQILDGATSNQLNGQTSNIDRRDFESGFGAGFLDDNLLSSINWLPTDYIPDYQEIPRTNSSLQPILPYIPTVVPSPYAPQLSANRNREASTLADPQSVSGSITSPRQPQYNTCQSLDEQIDLEEGQENLRTGQLYVDSDGARDPCTSRAKPSSAVVNRAEPSSPVLYAVQEGAPSRLGFPDLETFVLDGPARNIEHVAIIKYTTYTKIHQSFRGNCLDSHMAFPAFTTEYFPPISHLSLFVQLYFEYFAPICPFLHGSTFDPNTCHWLLTLAVASIGCRFTDSEEIARCVLPMQEFLRRAIQFESESQHSFETSPWLTQSILLNQIGMLYCGSKHYVNIARCNHSKLIEYFRKCSLLRLPEDDWDSWIRAETNRRLLYCIMLIEYKLLDCMLSYRFRHQHEPSLSLPDSRVQLPCNETIWEAKTDLEWRQELKIFENNPSMFSALQTLYVEKKVKPSIGEFSRILLVHALFEETWKIAQYFRRPLSSWVPSAQRPHRSTRHPDPFGAIVGDDEEVSWLPSVPIYSKWRNAACDCLDVLHWAANSTIAISSGVEHPTVFHLHIARIVLLVPYAHFHTLAEYVAQSTDFSSGARPDHVTIAEQGALHWVRRDQHKARLATLHAGALFWHARRYSVRGFYEPTAIFLTTLTLWAYGYYSSSESLSSPSIRPRVQSEGDRSGSASPTPSTISPNITVPSSSVRGSDRSYSSDNPTFIRLDRPNDDEMVQVFVRDGHPSRMTAYITNVGNICSPKGPERILREGCKILSTVAPAWGIAMEYIHILSAMAAIMARRGENAIPMRASGKMSEGTLW
ncbi:MAG: hypothetical protein M1834_001657 [Cirrosporium novae-zelandiae]|nr:MAG: hypothetical protein M1834_004174 [Cirrosporium novae-zelandiae]KAI9735641.1 MAG: hypothetical protein M1834_001657 [Cirrosporium novae-zelandiae]